MSDWGKRTLGKIFGTGGNQPANPEATPVTDAELPLKKGIFCDMHDTLVLPDPNDRLFRNSLLHAGMAGGRELDNYKLNPKLWRILKTMIERGQPVTFITNGDVSEEKRRLIRQLTDADSSVRLPAGWNKGNLHEKIQMVGKPDLRGYLLEYLIDNLPPEYSRRAEDLKTANPLNKETASRLYRIFGGRGGGNNSNMSL